MSYLWDNTENDVCGKGVKGDTNSPNFAYLEDFHNL
jgi:hypothetical protein